MKARIQLLVVSLLVASLAACGAASTGAVETATPTGATTVAVDPNNVTQLLAAAHERAPQDVTYARTEHVSGPRGVADGSGPAIFTRSPQRFQLNVVFPSAPSMSRTQTYDYGSRRITTTNSSGTHSSTTNIEPYYQLHNGAYRGAEQIYGANAYHVSGTLCQDQLCPTTDLWIRTSDLYVVKITQHLEASGVTADVAYTDPNFNTGATVPAP